MPSISIPTAIGGALASAAPVIGAVAGPVASLIGGSMNSSAAAGASQAQQNAAAQAAQEQLQAGQLAANTQLSMFGQTQANLAPYMQTGSAALSQLAGLFGLGGGAGGAGATGVPNTAALTSALTNLPGYQFGLGQGQASLDRSAASQGLLLSGQQQQASQEFGQNYAQQNAWQPYISQLGALGNLGESAAAMTGNIGQSAANAAGSAQLSGGLNAAQSGILGGQAAASGIVGSNNNNVAALNSALNNSSLSYFLNQGGGAGNLGALASNYGNYTTPGLTIPTYGASGAYNYSGYTPQPFTYS